MAVPVIDLHDEVAVYALAELREHRKARRLGDWHFFDALYKAYLAAIAGGLGVTMLSGVIGDQRVDAAGLREVLRIGPGALGVLFALALAFGLRSGARGGPIALEAAEVRYVLLAPVDRDVALRQPALRQLRFAAFAGLVTGAIVGLLAFRRFPGSPWSWIVTGAITGLATSLGMTGVAMVASGRRLSRRTATLLGLPLVVWSVADAASASASSPTSFLGEVALWPLQFRPAAAPALVVPLALAAYGLRGIGGLSLEAAERRGRLVSHLRFAATFQDIRTVMLLRRQLSSELPRSKPWITLRPARRGPAAWRRDWRGMLRWPATRILRLVILGAVVGLATEAAWSGTTPMILVAGLALFVAGLDAIEGLAQEIDHPDRRDSFPMATGHIHVRHLAAPTVVLAIVGLMAVAAAAAVGDPQLVLRVGLPLVLPGAAMAAGAAAVSSLRQPPDPGLLMMDATGSRLAFHHAFAPGLATLGPASALLVHAQLQHQPSTDPIGLAITSAMNLSILVILIFGWVRHRKGLAGYLAGSGTKDLGK